MPVTCYVTRNDTTFGSFRVRLMHAIESETYTVCRGFNSRIQFVDLISLVMILSFGTEIPRSTSNDLKA